MSDAGFSEREFVAFARYLGAREDRRPDAEGYARAHASLPARDDGAMDRWLVGIARLGVWPCTLADAYARRVLPYGLLRRKLVLALSVLESAPVSHDDYDRARPSSLPAAWAALVILGTRWLLLTVVAIVLLAPLHLASILVPHKDARG